MNETFSLSAKFHECHQLRRRSVKFERCAFAHLALIIASAAYFIWFFITMDPDRGHAALFLAQLVTPLLLVIYGACAMFFCFDACEKLDEKKREAYQEMLVARGVEIIDDLAIEFRVVDWKDLSMELEKWMLMNPEERFDGMARKLRAC